MVKVTLTVVAVTEGGTVVAVAVGVADGVVVVGGAMVVPVGPLTRIVRGLVVDCPSLWYAVTVTVYDPLAG